MRDYRLVPVPDGRLFGGSGLLDRPTAKGAVPHFLPKLEAHIAKSANRQRGDMLQEERDGAARVRTAPTPFRPTAYVQIRGKVFGGSASSAEPHVKAVVPHFRARIARHIAWARKSGAARDSARFAAHLEERVGKFHVRTWVP